MKTTEAFVYKNIRNDFNYCYYWEKWKTMSDYRDTKIPQGVFTDKVTPVIEGFTDKPVV